MKPAEAILHSLVSSGLMWGTADLVFAGKLRASERAGELAAYLTALTRDGEPAFSTVVVLWPLHFADSAQITADMNAALAATRRAHSKVALEDTVLVTEFASVQLVRPTHLG